MASEAIAQHDADDATYHLELFFQFVWKMDLSVLDNFYRAFPICSKWSIEPSGSWPTGFNMKLAILNAITTEDQRREQLKQCKYQKNRIL